MHRRLKFVRYAITLFAAPLLLWLMSAAVHAAAPANDTFPGATPVSGEFSEVIDTTEATTDDDDVQMNNQCGFSATDASVWYAFTAPEDVGVVVDVSDSDYSTGIMVGVGTQGNIQVFTCAVDGTTFFATAGTTYYVLLFDRQDDGGGNGGSLSVSFDVVPSPTVDITVDSAGQFNSRTGSATISGTYTCTGSDFIGLDANVRQLVGRSLTIQGGAGLSTQADPCDGTLHSWSVEVFPDNGAFKGGSALTRVFAYVCNQFTCVSENVTLAVQLQGGGKKVTAAAVTDAQLFLPSVQAVSQP